MIMPAVLEELVLAVVYKKFLEPGRDRPIGFSEVAEDFSGLCGSHLIDDTLWKLRKRQLVSLQGLGAHRDSLIRSITEAGDRYITEQYELEDSILGQHLKDGIPLGRFF